LAKHKEGLVATAIQATQAPPRIRSRYDHIFFPSIAAFILVSVFLGFAQSYYLQGILKLPDWKAFAAPPHPLLVHIHAAIFSSWILLLVAQSSLVAADRVDLHRRLGVAGFGLACLLVLVGLTVTCEFLSRHHGHEDPSLRFPFLQVVDLIVFSTLIYFGHRQRFHPDAHKRLMLIATVALLDAAFSRWPILVVGNGLIADFCCYALLAFLVVYDIWSIGKAHRATLWGSTLLIVAHHPILSILDRTVAWHRLAIYMQRFGDLLH
jgi:hypothetical protein